MLSSCVDMLIARLAEVDDNSWSHWAQWGRACLDKQMHEISPGQR